MDEISRAQVRLGRALDRARAGEDRALAGRVRDEGARLVNLVFGVLGMARLHALDNRAFDQPIKDLKEALDGLIDVLGAVHMLAVENQVYINDIRIRLEGRGEIAADLGAHLKQHGVGGISWHGRLTTAQLRKMTELLVSPAPAEHPRIALQSAFAAAEITSVEFTGIHRFRMSGETEVVRKRDLVTIETRGSSMIEEAWSNLSSGRLPNPLPLRRLVTDVLDAPTEDTEYWKDPDEVDAYAAHVIRVAKLALLIGRGLGLPAGVLQDLGLAAMFHDVGYATLPRNLDSESAFMRHGDAGALALVRQKGFHEAKVRRALAALDHHRRFDDPERRPSLFGRILAIAEDYDILAQSRGAGLTPPVALERMAAEAGRIYDPVLIRLFVNALGRYPPGTLLRLSDGRLARVVRGASDIGAFDKPVVRVERQSDGTRPTQALEIDLAPSASPRVVEVIENLPSAVDDDSRATDREAIVARLPPPPPAIANEAAGFSCAGAENARPLSLGLLPKVFGEIYRRKRSGTLKLVRGNETRSVRFWNGVVVRAASNTKREQLGEVAIREGLLRPDDLARATTIVLREKKRLGLVLMELGLMSEERLGTALAAHVRCVLKEPMRWSDGCYEFEEQRPASSWSEEVAFTLSTPDLILEGVRCVEDSDVIRFLLGDLGLRLRVSREPIGREARASLGSLDEHVLSLADGRLAIRDVIATIPEDSGIVARSIYGLLCIGLVECFIL